MGDPVAELLAEEEVALLALEEVACAPLDVDLGEGGEMVVEKAKVVVVVVDVVVVLGTSEAERGETGGSSGAGPRGEGFGLENCGRSAPGNSVKSRRQVGRVPRDLTREAGSEPMPAGKLIELGSTSFDKPSSFCAAASALSHDGMSFRYSINAGVG